MLLLKQFIFPNLPLKIIRKLQFFSSIRKANHTSKPNHGETTSMWQYDKYGKTSQKLKIATWSIKGLRMLIKNG